LGESRDSLEVSDLAKVEVQLKVDKVKVVDQEEGMMEAESLVIG